MKKKVMSWLLALSLFMTIFPVAALAADGEGTEAVAPPPKPPFILTSNMVRIAMTD